MILNYCMVCILTVSIQDIDTLVVCCHNTVSTGPPATHSHQVSQAQELRQMKINELRLAGNRENKYNSVKIYHHVVVVLMGNSECNFTKKFGNEKCGKYFLLYWVEFSYFVCNSGSVSEVGSRGCICSRCIDQTEATQSLPPTSYIIRARAGDNLSIRQTKKSQISSFEWHDIKQWRWSNYMIVSFSLFVTTN